MRGVRGREERRLKGGRGARTTTNERDAAVTACTQGTETARATAAAARKGAAAVIRGDHWRCPPLSALAEW